MTAASALCSRYIGSVDAIFQILCFLSARISLICDDIHKWTIQRKWRHRVHKMTTNKKSKQTKLYDRQHDLLNRYWMFVSKSKATT